MSERTCGLRSAPLLFLCMSLAACSMGAETAACVFDKPPNEDLLLGRVQHLEIVDAETGEVASYDNLGNPVLEGGQPLALWAVFNAPTQLELCVTEIDGNERPLHHSEVTFSEQLSTQPLGRYDIGSYLLLLSMNGTLVDTIEFNIR